VLVALDEDEALDERPVDDADCEAAADGDPVDCDDVDCEPHAVVGAPAFTHAPNAVTSDGEGAGEPAGGMGAEVLFILVTQSCATLTDGLVTAGAVRSVYVSRDIGAPPVGGDAWQETHDDCRSDWTSHGRPAAPELPRLEEPPEIVDALVLPLAVCAGLPPCPTGKGSSAEPV
jgi:hypothetical protein